MKLPNVLAVVVAVTASTLFASASIEADRGVGVTLGAVDIHEPLARGGGYSLPSIGVINTGDEPGLYEVVIDYPQDQRQIEPPKSWFSFQPQRFFLRSDETRIVDVRLTVPTSAAPGTYFAYIEARRIADQEGVGIGAAAAAKLSFTIKPSSWLEAQIVSINRRIDELEPWSYLVPVALLALLLLAFASRHLRLQSPVVRRR
jgi:hypothetical protein